MVPLVWFQSHQCIIICHPIMRHLSGPAAVIWALWSQCSHTWMWKVGTRGATLSLSSCQKSAGGDGVPLVRYQSHQCIIIYHTHNETSEWSSCSDLGFMVPVLTYLGVKSGHNGSNSVTADTSKVSWRRWFHLFYSNLISASALWFIIPTHNEILERSSCSGLGTMVPVHKFH